MALSTYSTVSLEDVIGQGAGNPYAFQLSILKDRDTVLRWVKRAEGELTRPTFYLLSCKIIIPRQPLSIGLYSLLSMLQS